MPPTHPRSRAARRSPSRSGRAADRPVRVGLEVLLDARGGPLRGRRVGLICNPTSVDSRLRHAADLLHALPGVTLARLFGPEHGVRGDAPYMVAVDGEVDRATGLEVHSLYGATRDSLQPSPAALEGLDVLCFDVQDV